MQCGYYSFFPSSIGCFSGRWESKSKCLCVCRRRGHAALFYCCEQTWSPLGCWPLAPNRSLWGTGRQRNAEQLSLHAFLNCPDCFMLPSAAAAFAVLVGVFAPWCGVCLVRGIGWTGNTMVCSVGQSDSWEEESGGCKVWFPVTSWLSVLCSVLVFPSSMQHSGTLFWLNF